MIGGLCFLLLIGAGVYFVVSQRKPPSRPLPPYAPAGYFHPAAAPLQPAPEVKLVNLLIAHKRETDAERELRKAKDTLDGLTEWASKPDPAAPKG